jgi:hypothetical protein
MAEMSKQVPGIQPYIPSPSNFQYASVPNLIGSGTVNAAMILIGPLPKGTVVSIPHVTHFTDWGHPMTSSAVSCGILQDGFDWLDDCNLWFGYPPTSGFQAPTNLYVQPFRLPASAKASCSNTPSGALSSGPWGIDSSSVGFKEAWIGTGSTSCPSGPTATIYQGYEVTCSAPGVFLGNYMAGDIVTTSPILSSANNIPRPVGVPADAICDLQMCSGAIVNGNWQPSCSQAWHYPAHPSAGSLTIQ